MENTIPFSGPYASYFTTISSLNLQLLISTQFTDNECLIWENSLREDLIGNHSKIVTDPILDRLRDNPTFMLNELWSSSISSAVINFTSTTEHYIRDMIKLNLQRNSSLRKKGFSDRQFRAVELEDELSLDDIKMKMFISIASEQSKGQLFSEKHKKASSFLGIEDKRLKPALMKSLDTIWELRNTIAHTNNGFLQIYNIHSEQGILSWKNEGEKQEYLSFCLSLLNVVDEFSKYLKEWDRSALEKWPATSFIS